MLKHWEYLLVKAALFYYLLPLPFLKKCYISLGQQLFGYDSMHKGYVDMTYSVLKQNGELHYNNPLQVQLFAGGIWLFGAFALFTFYLVRYLLFRKRILQSSSPVENYPHISRLLKQLKKELGIRRNVTAVIGDDKLPPCTIGTLRPIILLNPSSCSSDSETVLRHELIHIKRNDSLIYTLMYLVSILHWYNPFVYLLQKELPRMCELSCDEIVMKYMPPEEFKSYASLLVAHCRVYQQKPKWASTLSSEGKRIEERIKFIMKKKKPVTYLNRFLSPLIICISILSCSITVFAYNDITTTEIPEYKGEADIDMWKDMEGTFYLPGYDDQSDIIDHFVYDQQFVDEEGTIFPITDHASAYASCSHSYVKGTASYHTKISGTKKCIVQKYNAKRCSKCGYTVPLTLISETTYTVCPH